MRSNLTYALMGCVALGIVTVCGQPASAATLYNGWSYTFDPGYDSLGTDSSGNIIAGGTEYEIYGMAIKDDPSTDSIWVALNANLPAYGFYTGPTINGFNVINSRIGWGDLFFNFGSKSFLDASSSCELYGIRFSPNNDSGAANVGVYKNVCGQEIASNKAGFRLGRYDSSVSALTGGQQPVFGDLIGSDPRLFGSASNSLSFAPNVIAPNSGQKIGELALLSRENLIRAGFDPGFLPAQGSQTLGFRFAKSLFPGGEFVAQLFLECFNDGIAMAANLSAPPLPSPPPPAVCPVEAGQLNALQPDVTQNGVKIFNNAPSGQWFDPAGTMGYTFKTIGNRTFTAINNFPCGIFPNGDPNQTPVNAPFAIQVDGQFFGAYYPGDLVDFTSLFPNGVTEFTIIGLENQPGGVTVVPLVNPFALPLNFSTPTGGLRMEELITVQKLREQGIPTPVGPIPNRPGYEAVPEPSEMAGVALAAAGLFGLKRRFRKK